MAWWAGLTGPRYLRTGPEVVVWGGCGGLDFLEGFLEEREEAGGGRGEVEVEGEGEVEVLVEVEGERRKAFLSFWRKGIVGVGGWE